VIEGVRSPIDFVELFDPRQDCAVFLDYTGDEKPDVTEFEGGLSVIQKYLDWLITNGLLDARYVIRYTFPRMRVLPDEQLNPVADADKEVGQPYPALSLDHAATDFIIVESDRLNMLSPQHRAGAVRQGQRFLKVQAEIAPLAMHVRAEYLHDMKSHHGQLLPCVAFAISSYEGHAPTFKICLTEGDDAGTVFSYIPPSALIDKTKRTTPAADGSDPCSPELTLSELVYHNCPSGDICVRSFDHLQGHLNAFIKQRDFWLGGTYLLTIEWYGGNDLLHLIALDNGQHAFLPHHKVKFNDGPQHFSAFRKIRSQWKV
jgi:hypothetical protein